MLAEWKTLDAQNNSWHNGRKRSWHPL